LRGDVVVEPDQVIFRARPEDDFVDHALPALRIRAA
jgi:hypothetical protein